jgi:hypothetical protein
MEGEGAVGVCGGGGHVDDLWNQDAFVESNSSSLWNWTEK